MMTIDLKRIAYASVGALAALAIIQAATAGYYQKASAIRKEASEELQKLGLTRAAAKAKYPTPEIHMVSGGCLVPGGTGEVVVKGKFTPGTKFVLESDGIEVTKEALTATEYRASVKVAPDYPPHTAAVLAISPVSGISAYSSPGVAVSGRMEWNMEAANGWKIVAKSPADWKCGERGQDSYEVQFFRKGEAKPFETRSAKGEFTQSTLTEYFTVEGENALGSEGKSFESLAKKMSDPSLSDSERQKVMEELQKAQQAMMASMQNAQKLALEADARRKTFGCERIEVKLQGTSLTGTMRCGEAVGTRINLTGTMKSLGR
jgi:hypothetical protein